MRLGVMWMRLGVIWTVVAMWLGISNTSTSTHLSVLFEWTNRNKLHVVLCVLQTIGFDLEAPFLIYHHSWS